MSIGIVLFLLRSGRIDRLAVVPREARPERLGARRVKPLIVRLVLGDGRPRQTIHRVVRVAPFGRFILASTGVDVLAAEDGVGLEGLLPAQPVTVDVGVASGRDIEQLERGALPEIVATVHKLVDSPVKAAFFADLALAEPLSAAVKIQLIRFPE